MISRNFVEIYCPHSKLLGVDSMRYCDIADFIEWYNKTRVGTYAKIVSFDVPQECDLMLYKSLVYKEFKHSRTLS